MSEADYKLAMFYIDKIVEELNFIANKVHHKTFEEFLNEK